MLHFNKFDAFVESAERTHLEKQLSYEAALIISNILVTLDDKPITRRLSVPIQKALPAGFSFVECTFNRNQLSYWLKHKKCSGHLLNVTFGDRGGYFNYELWKKTDIYLFDAIRHNPASTPPSVEEITEAYTNFIKALSDVSSAARELKNLTGLKPEINTIHAETI
ncbi:hypothetical protein [Vibrio panuliri]|uniref:Uncharacterized protein n=1 Tax=Vibrio panuliri TaxID=1381081 RepID=A0ABX3FFI7_9VIBR|nr:hypothetical protein [Vibrio panuliri]KAB1460856.1 hypothetical protein F7O85_00330 [Vibrio panuliri]OLQ91662.1 hypothetical protein BIY20_09675 [Vibrio panuliri]